MAIFFAYNNIFFMLNNAYLKIILLSDTTKILSSYATWSQVWNEVPYPSLQWISLN